MIHADTIVTIEVIYSPKETAIEDMKQEYKIILEA